MSVVLKTENKNSYLKGVISICMAALCWGSIALFSRTITSYGASPEFSGLLRLLSASLFMFVYIFTNNKELFKIDKKGMIISLIIGFITQTLFNLSYQNAINKTTVSTAVILLYTSPIFVSISSFVFYKEKISKKKLCSLILCMVGAFITVTGFDLSTLKGDVLGILFGLGAGITYSMVPVLGKLTLSKYNSFSIVFYSFLSGFIFTIPFSNIGQIKTIDFDFKFLLAFLGFGLIGTVFPYLFYYKGMDLGVLPSTASIIATLEIVISIIVSIIFFKEAVGMINLFGILIVFGSIILVKDE
ncbi:MAG: DMT family transporter [Peptostreptococcaceae bacterium]|jgi:drug/metabolite transporter (DMT)-like permease|nr:DMT family transporter [Peptostreptococcaceae bacterium]